MYNTCGLLFLSFGFTMLKFITCDSDGAYLEKVCQTMDIDHSGEPPQDNEAPFKIEPEFINVTDSELGTNIRVSLFGDTHFFRGFMLDARESDNHPSAGRFTLSDSVSQLVCGGRAVVHSNNLDKTRIEVFWTPEEPGEFFFRAAFVQRFRVFWLRKPIPTPAVPSTSEATTTQGIPTTSATTTLFTTTSNIDSHPPGSSLLMIIRPVLKKVTMTASVIKLASKTIAVILILIKLFQRECDSPQIVFTALTIAALVSSLMHTISIFLYCGPSHELRKCWLCSLIVVDLTNTIITTTAIFIGILCFQESWLPLLMGVYVIWEFMLYLGSIWFDFRQQQNHNLGKRISPWLFAFIVFSVFNVMFTAALMTGVSLLKMESC